MVEVVEAKDTVTTAFEGEGNVGSNEASGAGYKDGVASGRARTGRFVD